MKTYHDYVDAKEKGQELDFIRAAINEYKASPEYKIALDADEYEAERNVTIMEFMRWLYNAAGQQVVDFTAANNRIASNFLHRLVTQRVAYSLGNGVSFTEDGTKDRLGADFDTVLYDAADFARLHRVSYLVWNFDHMDFFKMTEFCPLFDEYDGSLKAGFRFWSLDWQKRPVTVVVYEADGYTKYRTRPGSKGLDLVEYEPKRGYKQQIAHNGVDPDEVVGESNYITIPIVPFWGSKHRQSDLVGMRSKIDAYDLVKSGFANDLQDCAEIYWIIGNALGEDDASLARFRDRIKLNHIAVMDTDNSNITPYTQEIPTAARTALIDSLRAQIYEDYGGLDVHTIAAGATNDHIDAAYQPMDEEADDFEYQVIKAVRGILSIIGIDDMPIFKRNRISNSKEQVEMVMLTANYLDRETVLKKLPFLTVDEVENVLKNADAENESRFSLEEEQEEENGDELNE